MPPLPVLSGAGTVRSCGRLVWIAAEFRAAL